MAVDTEVGASFKLKIDENTFLCARSISFGGESEDINTSCAASGNVTESKGGKKSYSLSATSVIRVATGGDLSTQVTAASLESMFESQEVFPWEYGSDTLGATVKSGMASVRSFTEAAEYEGEATFDVEFRVTGPVVYTVNV